MADVVYARGLLLDVQTDDGLAEPLPDGINDSATGVGSLTSPPRREYHYLAPESANLKLRR